MPGRERRTGRKGFTVWREKMYSITSSAQRER